MPTNTALRASYGALVERSFKDEASRKAGNACCGLCCLFVEPILAILDGWGVIFCCCELYPAVEDANGKEYIQGRFKCYTSCDDWAKTSYKVTVDWIIDEVTGGLCSQSVPPVWDLDGSLYESAQKQIQTTPEPQEMKKEDEAEGNDDGSPPEKAPVGGTAVQAEEI